jgi:hypothetical protein
MTVPSLAPATTTSAQRPTGPLVRVCDRRLAATVAQALRAEGFRGRLPRVPTRSGDRTLSRCELDGAIGAGISLDAAADAPRRYRNRVTETAQFAGGDPGRAPKTVKGIGDARLGAAGANWLPRIHLLLSVRGERVLIVDLSADDLGDGALLAAASEISVATWDRLSTASR